MEQPNNIVMVFAKFFPKIILQNEIVCTILKQFILKLNSFKNDMDNKLNTDI